jgi:hypothetical protein
MTLYQFDWDFTRPNLGLCYTFQDYKFDGVLVEGVLTEINLLAPYPYDKSYTVAYYINMLGLSTLQAVAYKTTFPENTEDPVIFSLILNVDALDDVFLRIRNADNSQKIYLKGDIIPSIPLDYLLAPTPIIYMTTTTTTTTSSTTTTTTAPPL